MNTKSLVLCFLLVAVVAFVICRVLSSQPKKRPQFAYEPVVTFSFALPPEDHEESIVLSEYTSSEDEPDISRVIYIEAVSVDALPESEASIVFVQ